MNGSTHGVRCLITKKWRAFVSQDNSNSHEEEHSKIKILAPTTSNWVFCSKLKSKLHIEQFTPFTKEAGNERSMSGIKRIMQDYRNIDVTTLDRQVITDIMKHLRSTKKEFKLNKEFLKSDK